MPSPDDRSAIRRLNLWSALAGFGLAGLFDSVLLHRVLGWHHLLAQRRPEEPLGWHMQTDGAFDAAMLAALLAGLAGLLAARKTLAATHPRCVTGMALIGFGLWNVIDAVLVHWALGLHRIRPDAETPLLWDIGWLATFGLFPLLIGLSMRKTTDPGGPG